VKNNFGLVTIGIAVISVLPMVIALFRRPATASGQPRG
jgi:hypothetical protein